MESENAKIKGYASVILPLKYNEKISYFFGGDMDVEKGSRVKVDLAGKIYGGFVCDILSENQIPHRNAAGKEIVYKPILEVEPRPRITENEFSFWKMISAYYLCNVGEVFKAAYPALAVKQESVKPRKTLEHFLESVSRPGALPENLEHPQLSPLQLQTTERIRGCFAADHRPVLLRGVTGSGKTEIYITLALEQLEKGKDVLYLVPEIALTRQLQNRLKKVFGDRLLVFHSRQTAAEKARIHKILHYTGEQNAASVILGTRSSVFLPFSRLGLVVVDEEHDSSYKQTEPAPRYNGRDAAIMLATLSGAECILGSATPSFESEYNVLAGRFHLAELKEKYFGAVDPDVEIIDTIWARKSRQMKGDFSQQLLNEIRKTVEAGYQVLVFRNRRSYAPVVECAECGEIPKCPHCNVYLSYHRYNNTLRCHYCDYITPYTGVCPHCGTASMIYRGAGTEKIEEELKALLPELRIARYDADVARSKREEEKTIREFSEGKTDVLVGTQMISKGFDFARLKLVAVLQADSILGVQDFRGDEKALQLFSQLMGRTGRRDVKGKLMIQTNQKDHPVFRQLLHPDALAQGGRISALTASLLCERQEFSFAPYVRMVKIIARHRDMDRLDRLCAQIREKLSGDCNIGYRELTGPFTPVIDKVRGEWIKCFYIKFARDRELARNKARLKEMTDSLGGRMEIILDVDPL